MLSLLVDWFSAKLAYPLIPFEDCSQINIADCRGSFAHSFPLAFSKACFGMISSPVLGTRLIKFRVLTPPLFSVNTLVFSLALFARFFLLISTQSLVRIFRSILLSISRPSFDYLIMVGDIVIAIPSRMGIAISRLVYYALSPFIARIKSAPGCLITHEVIIP